MLAILTFALGAGSARAAPLEKAKAAIDNSEYFAARSELETALRAGDNKPAELAEIHRLSGIVAAALGDPKAAKESFQRSLALAPQTSLPAGTSPKIAKPFAAAQDFFKDKQPLQLKTATSGDPPSVTIDVVEDPLTMIAKLQAVVIVDGKPEQTIEKPTDKQVKLDLPKGKRIDLRVVAIDEHGNHLVELGTREVPIVIVGKAEAPVVVVTPPKKPVAPPTPDQERPLYLRWWLWGGASVALLGASGYFGIDTVRKKNRLDDLVAESANHSFDEAKSLEDSARTSALVTNITLIAGGALAVTATVLYLTRPRGVEQKSISVAPVVHPTGAGLVLGGHF